MSTRVATVWAQATIAIALIAMVAFLIWFTKNTHWAWLLLAILAVGLLDSDSSPTVIKTVCPKCKLEFDTCEES